MTHNVFSDNPKSTAFSGSGFARKEREKGQNCSVPLRYTAQFSQIIKAALFMPQLFKRVYPNFRPASCWTEQENWC